MSISDILSDDRVGVFGIIFVDAHGGKYNVINARGINEEAWYRLATVRDFLNDAVLT